MPGPAVVFEGVTFCYPGTGPIVEDASLTVETRQHVCVIGPNGGGKTTLLRLALGLLSPERGRIEAFGIPPHRACKHVGYVPQHTNLRRGFPITVREVVLTGCVDQHRLGWHKASCGSDADRVMQELEIEDLAAQSFDRLSGGQRQRVLIARALVGNPSLLLLDEPTANVDPSVEKHVRELIGQLCERMAVVTVSHDLDYIHDGLDQVLFVNRTVRSMSPADVTSDLVWELYSHRR
jgi:zinc transport system ATP-binding protein